MSVHSSLYMGGPFFAFSFLAFSLSAQPTLRLLYVSMKARDSNLNEERSIFVLGQRDIVSRSLLLCRHRRAADGVPLFTGDTSCKNEAPV